MTNDVEKFIRDLGGTVIDHTTFEGYHTVTIEFMGLEATGRAWKYDDAFNEAVENLRYESWRT